MDDNGIIQQLFTGKSITITPIVGKGNVNRVYIVEQEKNKVVVRLNSGDELPRFKKESWCLGKAKKIGIPSPQLIDLGVKDEIAYMILSFISGKNGKEIVKNKEMIWETIGSYAKKIHSIPTRGFGENMISLGIFSDSWERYLNYNIDSLVSDDTLLSMGTIDKKQSLLIKDKLIKLKNKKFNFGLIHGDLSLENVIVDGDKVTLIDWGVAETTIIPHLEIIDLFQNQNIKNTPLFKRFLKGYGMTREEFVSIRHDINTLTLLQNIDKLRWAIDKCPEQIKNFSQRVKSTVDGLRF